MANLLGLAACIEGDSAVGLLSEGYTLAVVLQIYRWEWVSERRKVWREGLMCHTIQAILQDWPPEQVVVETGAVTWKSEVN